MTWRIFRAPDLAFWTLAVLVLGALAIVAANIGADPGRAANAPGTPVIASATTSAAREPALNLQALMPAGTAAGTDAAALKAWAAEVERHANEGAAIREREGAASDDDLRMEFTQITTYTAQLHASAADPVAATAIRTQIGLRVSRVVALVSGMPAPALPAGATDLFGQSGNQPAQPDTTSPSQPALPDAPIDPTRP